MEAAVRARDKDPLAQFLGWFSVALGTAQVAAPRMLCRYVGADTRGRAPRIMRVMGVREVAQGIAILVRPRPTMWLWSRVAGDAVDLALLGTIAVRNRRARTGLAIANVVVVTVPDIYESRFLSRKTGPVRGARLVRKAVTVNTAQDEVEQAWAESRELRSKVERAGASVTFARAPGERGTELFVEFEHDPPLGDIGAAVQKLAGKDLATQLSDDLRRFKQQVETGQVVRSDGTPNGHLLADHLRQRAARPVEEGAR